VFTIRFLAALILGYVAQEILVIATGVGAALSIPTGYLEYFGRHNQQFALRLWNFWAFAVPLFIFSALLAWSAFRLLRRHEGLIYACILGSVLCWLRYMIVVPSEDENSMQFASSSQFWSMFSAVYLGSVWDLPSAWASWLGMATGIFVTFKYANPASTLPAEA